MAAAVVMAAVMGAVVPLVFRHIGDQSGCGFGAADHDAQRWVVAAAIFWDCGVFLVRVGDGCVSQLHSGSDMYRKAIKPWSLPQFRVDTLYLSKGGGPSMPKSHVPYPLELRDSRLSS